MFKFKALCIFRFLRISYKNALSFLEKGMSPTLGLFFKRLMHVDLLARLFTKEVF